MMPGMLVATLLAVLLLVAQLKVAKRAAGAPAGLLIPQLLAICVMSATTFEVINLWQNYTLLLFIVLQYALGAIWEIYRVVTDESRAQTGYISSWLWLLYAATAAALLFSFL